MLPSVGTVCVCTVRPGGGDPRPSVRKKARGVEW
ncbi:hypothetical protein TSAR_008169, partial [Trichomalopsis sarcophagae]